jgi:hypothetical protein
VEVALLLKYGPYKNPFVAFVLVPIVTLWLIPKKGRKTKRANNFFILMGFVSKKEPPQWTALF